MDLGFSPFLHDHHTQTSSYLLIYFILLVTTIIVQQKLTNYTNYVPEACVSTGLGLLISLLFYLCGGYRPNYNNYNESQFNVNSIRLSETLFYFGLLPPILFNSGFHLRRKLFVRNIKPIFLLAIVGTLISTFVIAFVLKYLYDNHSTSLFGGAHVEIELMEFIVFASLLSSTDPVAVLAAFSKIRVEPNLFLIVMGESSLNDAVALTLFKVTSSYVGNQMKTNDVYDLIVYFVICLVVSVLLGYISGIVLAIILKKIDIRQHTLLQVSFSMLCAYIPYFLSETLQLSGIVTCIFSGISCRRYLKKNLSKDAGVIMQLIFNITSHCAEVSCFLLLGLSVFHQKKEDVDVPFIIISFVLTLVARIIHVYPLVAMCNAHELCKKSSEDKQQLKTKIISCNAMTILVFGGLRGAVAYSCANIFPDNNGNRKLFLSTTTGVVLATIFFQGILIYPLILLLNVSSKQVDEGNLLKCGDDTIETINWEKKWIYPLVLGNDYPVYKDSRDARVQEDEISSAGGSFHTTKFHTLEGNEPLHSLKQEEECGDNIYNRDTVEETPFSDDDDDFYQPRKNVELTYENLQEHHKIWNFREIMVYSQGYVPNTKSHSGDDTPKPTLPSI